MKSSDSINARRILRSTRAREPEVSFDAQGRVSSSPSRQANVPNSPTRWRFGALIASVGLCCAVVQACSSDAQTLAGGQAGAAAAPSGAAGGTTTLAPTTPGTPASGEITCDGPNPDRTCFPVNTELSCTTTNASTDAACTIDCRIECGFNGIGLKHCSCVAGRYESCPCARPTAYLGASTADFCPNNAMADDLDETPCDQEWNQCIANDPVTGTPRGCACMRSDAGELQWFCGSTNNWFALVSETGDGVCEGETPDLTCDVVNPDASCSTADARTGSACSMDCRVPCGFQQAGVKICTCAGGVYSQCPCPKPEGYLGEPTAPPCPTSDGTTEELDDTPCTLEWQQCIGSDAVTGNTPRGCVCMTNRLSSVLQWYCGSTNRWFAPE